MNILNSFYSIFDKKLFECGLSSGYGLFYNDLNFFHFEIYFILSIITFLVFFVILSNKNTTDSYYLFAGFYYNDIAIVFFKNIILLGFLVFIFAIKQYISHFKHYDFEFILILFISLFSSILILNSNDLISLF